MRYDKPKRLDRACKAVAEGGLALAGGTDLLVGLGRDEDWPAALVDLKALPELGEQGWIDDSLRLGAGLTLAELKASPHLEDFPALRQACRVFAGRQIRERATIGGNLANASPAADLVPPLLVFDAVCVTDRRRFPLSDLATGPGETILEPGELLVAVQLPRPRNASGSFYHKLASREAMAVSVVGVAGMLALREGKVEQIRLAMGSVGPTVIRARRAEAAIQGKSLTLTNIAEAARLAASESAPISDLRGSADYRRRMVERITAWELRKLIP